MLIYLRKKDFPFDYWDSFEKFKEGLPSKNKFYNTLNNCAISDKNYSMYYKTYNTLNNCAISDKNYEYVLSNVLESF